MRSKFLILAVLLNPLLAPCAELAIDFEHLSLTQAYVLALQRNHDLKMSAFAVESSQAGVISANAAPNPTLTIQSANINPKQGIGTGNWRSKTLDTTFRIDQLIERGDKRGLRTENAQHLERAAKADLGDTRRQLRIAVSQAYFDLLAAQENRSSLKETVALYDVTLTAAQKRKQAGDIAGSDVERIVVDALRSRNDFRQAEADLLKARLRLEQVIGMRPPNVQTTVTDPWPKLTIPGLHDGIERIVERRPDVQAAQAREAAARAAHKLALAARTRDVTVGLQYEHWPISDVNSQGTGNSFGVSIQIPLFVRYYFGGEIRTAQAALDTAQESVEKTRDTARNDFYRSEQEIQASAERVRRYQDELLISAKRAAGSAEYAFKNGAIGVMDVLDARRTLRATETDAIAAQADYAKSLEAWKVTVLEDKDAK